MMADSNEELLDITINTLTGKQIEIKVTSVDTVQSVKETVEKVWKIPESQCNLIFNERELKDEDILRDIGIQNGSKLHLVVNMKGGPLTMGSKVFSEGVKNLKDVMEQTKKDIAGKYPAGSRLLVLLYKDPDGNHHFVRVYDENEYAKACVEEADEDSNDSNEESVEISEEDQRKVLEKLHEEMRMKMRVLDLKDQMNLSALQRKMRKKKGRKTFRKKKWIISDTSSQSLDGLDIYDKILLFSQEFSYTTFMKSYYDRWKYTAEMLNSTNLLFRLAQPRAVEGIIEPLEENRGSNHYILIPSPPEKEKRRRLNDYANTKREEMETITFGLREGGLPLEEVEKKLKLLIDVDVLPNPRIQTSNNYVCNCLKDLKRYLALLHLDWCRNKMIEVCRNWSSSLRGSSSETTSSENSESSTANEEDAGPSTNWEQEDVPRELWDTPELARLVWGCDQEEGSTTDTDDDIDSSGMWTDEDVPESNVIIRDSPPVWEKFKCAVCGKILRMINNFDCRCDNLHCYQHRHPEFHNCDFDYRETGKETKQNPKK